MPPDAPRCRRCGAPAAGVVAVSELDAGWASRPVAELALCGAHLLEVSQACGFEAPRRESTREVVRG